MEYVRCPACSDEVTSDSDFCPHCGELFEMSDGVRCARHAGNTAVAVCIICRNTVCRECGVRRRGRWLCPDHRAVTVEQDWALVIQTPDINRAELVRSVLESAGYTVVARNFGPNTAVWEGGGDSLMSRHALNRPAKLFVPIPEYEGATATLNDWESSAASITDNEHTNDERP